MNDTATPEIYTLSLHDALPICLHALILRNPSQVGARRASKDHVTQALVDGHDFVERHASLHPGEGARAPTCEDRKSTRLNSSHPSISYAVFCLKKQNTTHRHLS